ncbi:hypothetical protein NNO_1411 [Hydrogenimonas sp.]|nr:hypothetical protein NNO_1411 [Hydrogenimonas sp.]
MKKTALVLTLLAASLFAEKADVLDVKIKKSYGGSYIADVKIRHHDKDFKDFVSEWEILDQNRKPISVRLEFEPKTGKEIFESELIGFRIPKGATELIFRAKCSKDGFGGKEYILDLSKVDLNSSY